MTILSWLFSAASAIGTIYFLFAAATVRRFAARAPAAPIDAPAVSVLKPLCGAEADLYDNLASFCRQDYPRYEVLFGVQDPNDPAIAVARRVTADHPGRARLVIDESVRGTNRKVSNLENILAVAAHEVLVIADSDMRVREDYLREVVAPLAAPGVGLVTCLYSGRPAAGVWSGLGAMFINHGFFPAALVGERLDPGKGCFGATIALRRDTLASIGGFAALRDQLADDYLLGARVRDRGLEIVLSSHVVENSVHEPDFATLFRHELRWQRTIRSIAPLGHAGAIVTHGPTLGVIAVLAGGFAIESFIALAAAVSARFHLIATVNRAFRLAPAPLLLLPVREALSFLVFVASFCGRSIAWRGRILRLKSGGRLAES